FWIGLFLALFSALFFVSVSLDTSISGPLVFLLSSPVDTSISGLSVSSTPGISPDVAALTTEVSELKNMMKTMLIDKQKA
ncbi:hypothetical protein Tco_1520532, partial [Tanacetum coccineum]